MAYPDIRLPRIGVLPPRHPAVPVVLSFCSAFVDVCCYLGLFHTFTGFVTGTLVILCAELFVPDAELWTKVLVMVVFLTSAIAWIEVLRSMVRAGIAVVRTCLWLECGLVALFMLSAVALPVGPELLSPGTALALTFATIGMALQNAVMQMLLQFHSPTTVMTGNFLRFLVTALGAAPEAQATAGPHAPGAGRYGWALAGFLAGGVAGAAGMATVGFWGLLVPVAMLGTLAALHRA